MARSIRPNVVSRFLSELNFKRFWSTASRVKGFPLYSSGYEVTSRDGRTFVEYNLGSGNSHMREERRMEIMQRELSLMADALSTAYVVEDLGEGSCRKLEVKPKTVSQEPSVISALAKLREYAKTHSSSPLGTVPNAMARLVNILDNADVFAALDEQATDEQEESVGEAVPSLDLPPVQLPPRGSEFEDVYLMNPDD